jgi:hypothetical protein
VEFDAGGLCACHVWAAVATRDRDNINTKCLFACKKYKHTQTLAKQKCLLVVTQLFNSIIFCGVDSVMEHAVETTSVWFDENLVTLLLAYLTADTREGWAGWEHLSFVSRFTSDVANVSISSKQDRG